MGMQVGDERTTNIAKDCLIQFIGVEAADVIGLEDLSVDEH